MHMATILESKGGKLQKIYFKISCDQESLDICNICRIKLSASAAILWVGSDLTWFIYPLL